MFFKVLSHAGLMVSHQGKTLLFDPWLVGSCYWRSWWNFPKVEKSLVEDLKPDFIYLTHLHWDHFHGPSLRKFDPKTPILVPKLQFDRMRADLHDVGFDNVIELDHGERFAITEDFSITSYQFNFVVVDSAVVVEAGGVTLLNANDAKFMGLPLKQIIQNHAPFDFVFRSHSSANDRLCYELIGDQKAYEADDARYIDSFYYFARKVGAKYAIPFASNNCYLHPETFRFNQYSQTPLMVRDYFEARRIASPALRIMLSGDSWSQEGGFLLADPEPFFEGRDAFLARYLEENAEALRKQEEKERRARIRLLDMERYFGPFLDSIPFPIRRKFRGKPVTFVFSAGDERFLFRVDVAAKTVSQVESWSDETDPLQIHASAFIARQALALKMVDQLAISKRIRFRSSLGDQKLLKTYMFCHVLYEHHVLPLRLNFKWKALRLFAMRWREWVLFLVVVKDVLLGRRFEEKRYL